MVSWTLNAVGLFVTTTAALLIFLYLANTAPRAASAQAQAGADQTCIKHPRRVLVAVGLLAAWLVMQYAALVFF